MRGQTRQGDGANHVGQTSDGIAGAAPRGYGNRMKLLIGNKNYSSWSMRPWILMKHLDIAFDEERISFNDPDFGAHVARWSPARKVPVLIDEEVVIWDSLAIVEYLAERFPDRGVWPRDRRDRARARSNVAEMHSGFAEMRRTLPMNCEARFSDVLLANAVRKDVDRLLAMWSDTLETHADAGPFLFGPFSAADAYFAPVTVRFGNYGVSMPTIVKGWVDALHRTSAMRAWLEGALGEREFVEEDEIYRAPGR